ncbi:MAG: hypothetical protein Q4B26_07785 [Eubacteriales bacterium]|nr:hypothetical protein [Eubacteriales bacterium]
MNATTISTKEEVLSSAVTLKTEEDKCEACACSSCYGEGFCDHCSTCSNASRFRDRCNAYEGPYTY